MNTKGFTDNTNNIETPNDINVSEKPLKPKKISSGRVDINVLKSKLEAQPFSYTHLTLPTTYSV